MNGEFHWREFGHIRDLFVNGKVFWKLNSGIILGNLISVKLKNANQWLVLNLGIVIDDQVEAALHRANTLAVQLYSARDRALLQIDILSSGNASSLLNDALVLLDSKLEGVREGLVTSFLLNTSFDNSALVGAEVDPGLSHFTLFVVLVIWEVNRHGRQRHRSLRALLQEELLVELSATLMVQYFMHRFDDKLDFAIEILERVVDHNPVLVAHVYFTEFFIFCDSFRNRFITSLIAQRSIELHGTVSGGNHVKDSIVTIVTHANNVHVHVVHERLPFLACHVSRTVKKTSVNQDNDVLVSDHLSDFQEALFKSDLQLHETLLEQEPLLGGERGRDDHSATFHEKSGGLGHDQHFVTKLSQVLLNLSESCRLSSTGTTGE